ncbi:MAG TPA: twin-arginine translocation signal domain-containing protein, partial [Hanamia sp.]|nr:twin-arginine translocation signal domain-containing protein [Hanamia sp.]
MNSRRKFLQNSASIVGGTMLVSATSNNAFAILKNKISPNEQLNIGAVGVNGMGFADLSSALKIPGVNVVAICDVDADVIARRMKDLAKMNIDTSKIKIYDDYR